MVIIPIIEILMLNKPLLELSQFHDVYQSNHKFEAGSKFSALSVHVYADHMLIVSVAELEEQIIS